MTINRNVVVVLKHTTYQQLLIIRRELVQRYDEVAILWNRAQEEADCTDQIDNDLDGLFAALFNFMCDIEVFDPANDLITTTKVKEIM